jgi:hypothetical protein
MLDLTWVGLNFVQYFPSPIWIEEIEITLRPPVVVVVYVGSICESDEAGLVCAREEILRKVVRWYDGRSVTGGLV